MEKSSYPFTRCYNPVRFMNRFTGELVEAPCGVCKACLLERARKMSLRCSIEESEHKYCMFVTLTYSDEYIPKAKPVLSDPSYIGDSRSYTIDFVSVCDRLGEAGLVVCSDDVSEKQYNEHMYGYIDMLLHKTNLGGFIGYCSKRDVQLFVKRLRKNLKKYTDEKIRYYAVSEYGPKTFRPHYHLLVFYDQEETQKAMSQCLRKSWQYGRIDYSLSRGKCSDYVAKYVNSNSFVPRFLAGRSTKPFALHSWYFACGVYKSQKKEIYKNAPDSFVRVGRIVGSKYVEFTPWRSLACSLFPKCKGFDCKDFDELYQSYTILLKAKEYFGRSVLSISKIAENIIKGIELFKDNYSLFIKLYSIGAREVTQYFFDNPLLNRWFVHRKELSDFDARMLYKSAVSSISSELYVSKAFINHVCDGHIDYDTCSERLRMIVDYWKSRDAYNLNNMYVSQSSFCEEHPEFDAWKYFYVNRTDYYSDPVTNLECYKEFVCQCEEDFANSIKHKELNDANMIFMDV